MTGFFERMADGFGAAGWVIGLLLGLGILAAIIWCFGYMLAKEFGDEENADD